MLRWFENTKLLRAVWFPVCQGVDVGPKMGAMLKGQGKIRAGVSDFIFMWSVTPLEASFEGYVPIHMQLSHLATCGAIELKRPGGGGQSEDQQKFESWCAEHRIPYRVARSIDEVVEILVSWGRLPANAIERIRGVSLPGTWEGEADRLAQQAVQT